jgi:amino acid permease
VDDAHPVDLATIGKGTLFTSFAALANTLLGAGILGLPAAFAATGWAVGLSLLTFFAGCSAFGLHLLYCCASHTGIPSSFGGVSQASVPWLAWAIDAAISVKCFGVATSYLIVVGDSMPEVLRDGPTRLVWILIGFAVVTPLAYLRTLTALRFTAVLSLSFVAFTTFLVAAYTLPALNPCPIPNTNTSIDSIVDPGCGQRQAARVDQTSFAKLSVFVFAYTCHQNAFATLHNELKNPTPLRANLVIGMSISLALFMYCTMSLAGYFIFGDKVGTDVLKGFSEDAVLFKVARALVSVLVCFCFPLQVNPARVSILGLLRRCGARMSSFANSRLSHWVVTTCFLGLSLLVAIVVTDLGIILSIVGATGSTTVTFILPGLCYYKLFPHPHCKRTLALCQCVLGCAIFPFALFFIFKGVVGGH